MPRPKTPLLSRTKIVEGAIGLIDEVGLDKFSIYRLARDLNVKGPSIYYYFSDGDELLAAVCLHVLQDVKIPRRRSPDWTSWLTQDAVAYYRALKAHPNLAAAMLERKPRPGAAQRFDEALAQMKAAGIPPAYGLALIDCIEGLALSWIAFEQAPLDETDTADFKTLDEARRKQRYDEASYKSMIQALFAGAQLRYGKDSAATE